MNGYLKPSEVFASDVWPAYEEYRADPLSERRAMNAASAIDHHLDWTFEYYSRVDPSRLIGRSTHSEFRDALFGECRPLRIMWEISDASHHRFLEPRKVQRRVTAATDAFVEINNELWIVPYKLPFLRTLETAVAYWQRWLD
jgi:hypothetical protein